MSTSVLNNSRLCPRCLQKIGINVEEKIILSQINSHSTYFSFVSAIGSRLRKQRRSGIRAKEVNSPCGNKNVSNCSTYYQKNIHPHTYTGK